MKQILIIRRDLGMRRGKEIVQGAHASQMALTEARRLMHPCDVDFWIEDGMRKVGVQVESEAELVAVYEAAVKAGLPAAMVVDQGLTEFAGVHTKTAVGIGPSSDADIDPITRHLRLY